LAQIRKYSTYNSAIKALIKGSGGKTSGFKVENEADIKQAFAEASM